MIEVTGKETLYTSCSWIDRWADEYWKLYKWIVLTSFQYKTRMSKSLHAESWDKEEEDVQEKCNLMHARTTGLRCAQSWQCGSVVTWLGDFFQNWQWDSVLTWSGDFSASHRINDISNLSYIMILAIYLILDDFIKIIFSLSCETVKIRNVFSFSVFWRLFSWLPVIFTVLLCTLKKITTSCIFHFKI